MARSKVWLGLAFGCCVLRVEISPLYSEPSQHYLIPSHCDLMMQQCLIFLCISVSGISILENQCHRPSISISAITGSDGVVVATPRKGTHVSSMWEQDRQV